MNSPCGSTPVETAPSEESVMAHEFKSILVGLIPSDDEVGAVTPAMRFGLGLARRFGSTVTFHAFVPRAAAPYSLAGGFAGGIIAAENKRRRELAQAAIEAAKALAGEAGVTFILDMPDLPLEALTERFNQLTRLQDVTVMDAGDDLLGENRHAIEEALFNSGKPLIVVPKTGGSPQPQRIAIAWDGSARSARAVSDALPLLQAAQSVAVVVVGGEKDISNIAPGTELLGYLSRHGVSGEVVSLAAKDGNAAGALRRYAQETSAELIVMGAFVHSRFRQAVLGGVTRSLLENSPVPIFLTH